MRLLTIRSYVLLLLIVCFTPYALANAQVKVFSSKEVQQIEEIDPEASVVIRGDKELVEIENKTASIVLLENIQGKNHEIYLNSNLPKLLSERGKAVIGLDAAYRNLALSHCSKHGRLADWGVATGLYRKAYRCQSAEQWLEKELKWQISMCSKYGKGWEGILKSEGGTGVPNEFTALFAKYVPIRDCSGVRIGLEMLNLEARNSAHAAREKNAKAVISDLDKVKLICAELGFNVGTEKFGECVLRLTK